MQDFPVPEAPRSKAWVCGRSPAEIVGSNPTGGMDVCRECCVLSGRGLCVGLITRPEEPYRLWCVFLCDQETQEWEGHGPLGKGGGAVAPKGKMQDLEAITVAMYWLTCTHLKFSFRNRSLSQTSYTSDEPPVCHRLHAPVHTFVNCSHHYFLL